MCQKIPDSRKTTIYEKPNYDRVKYTKKKKRKKKGSK